MIPPALLVFVVVVIVVDIAGVIHFVWSWARAVKREQRRQKMLAEIKALPALAYTPLGEALVDPREVQAILDRLQKPR